MYSKSWELVEEIKPAHEYMVNSGKGHERPKNIILLEYTGEKSLLLRTEFLTL